MPKMSDAEIRAIAEILKGITPGDWAAGSHNGRTSGIAIVRTEKDRRTGHSVAVLTDVNPNRHTDAAFIAAAPRIIRYLLDEISQHRPTALPVAEEEVEEDINTERVNQ